jgi:hypothetical protein
LKKLVVAIAVVGGLGALGAGLAGVTSGLAGSARADSWETTPPTTPFSGSSTPTGDAQSVVSQFTASGYHVILNKFGAAPLDQCKVTGVTPGQQIITPVTSGAKGLAQVVKFTTVYVSADCTTRATPVPVKSGG